MRRFAHEHINVHIAYRTKNNNDLAGKMFITNYCVFESNHRINEAVNGQTGQTGKQKMERIEQKNKKK